MERKFFKVGLLISAGIHFSLFVFFPIWKTPPKKPQVIEVALIVPQPEKTESKKSPPPPPPVQKEVVERKPLPLSPVEVEVRVSQNIPALSPTAKSESRIKIPFPRAPFEEVASYRKEALASEKKIPHPAIRKAPSGMLPSAEIFPAISSPLRGDVPSITPSLEQGEGEKPAGARMPVGIVFRGLGTRKIIFEPEFTYPPKMEEEGREGSGVVEVDVTPEGLVVDVRIIRSAGLPEFDHEIQRKARYYRFSSIDEPGIKTYEGDFEFRLGEKSS
ncbi:TonB family protein [Candidatus Aerophobetes bacterium]|nr:TonB family protein [Candidatus Aerophobetes bacterium]